MRTSRAGPVMAAALGFALFATSARADVVLPEPNENTCESDVIAVATLDALPGGGPFDHAHAPDLTLHVTRAFKGCAEGDALRVIRWSSGQPPVTEDGGKIPRETLADFEKTAVEIPAVGQPVLLFLGKAGAGWTQYRNGWKKPIFFPAPTEAVLALTKGLLTFEVAGVLGPRTAAHPDRAKPIDLVVTIKNLTGKEQTFDPRSFEIRGLRGPGRRLTARPVGGREALPEAVRLAANATRSVTWDLRSFLPLVLPGRYEATLGVPARIRGGSNVDLQLDLEVNEPVTVEDAVAGSYVLLATAGAALRQPDGRLTVTFPVEKRTSVGDASAAPPVMVPWPKDRPQPAEGDVLILGWGPELGGMLGGLTFVAPRTDELEKRARAAAEKH